MPAAAGLTTKPATCEMRQMRRHAVIGQSRQCTRQRTRSAQQPGMRVPSATHAPAQSSSRTRRSASGGGGPHSAPPRTQAPSPQPRARPARRQPPAGERGAGERVCTRGWSRGSTLPQRRRCGARRACACHNFQLGDAGFLLALQQAHAARAAGVQGRHMHHHLHHGAPGRAGVSRRRGRPTGPGRRALSPGAAWRLHSRTVRAAAAGEGALWRRLAGHAAAR